MWSGWNGLCRILVARVEPCLRAGIRRGWRRALLAVVLWRTRRHWCFFYTVQTSEDEKRLRGRGTPWPTGDTRAHLGPGVYAWKHASDARRYRAMLLPQVPDLRILRIVVLRCRVESFASIDVDAQPDPGVWMSQHTLLITSAPIAHGAQYVRRHTSVPRGEETAVEHFFTRSVFPCLFFLRGCVNAD